MLRLREKLIFKEISAFSELLLCLPVFCTPQKFYLYIVVWSFRLLAKTFFNFQLAPFWRPP